MIDRQADQSPVQFSILKFVPDPIRDETINVGIVARFDEHLVLRSVPSFGRVRRIAGVPDTAALETALLFLRSTLDRSPDLPLNDLVSSSFGILRFSQLLGGLADDPSEFVDEQYEIYVHDNAPVRSASIETRTSIRTRFRRVISGHGGDSERFSIWKQRVLGATGKHEFDFGFENGHISLVRGISLQTQESYALNDARALSFAALDTKQRVNDMELTAIVAPPQLNEGLAAHREAMHLITSHADRVILLDGRDADGALEAAVPDVRHLRPMPRELLDAAVGVA